MRADCSGGNAGCAGRGRCWRWGVGAGAANAGDAINLEGMEFDIPGLDWLMDPAMMGFTM